MAHKSGWNAWDPTEQKGCSCGSGINVWLWPRHRPALEPGWHRHEELLAAGAVAETDRRLLRVAQARLGRNGPIEDDDPIFVAGVLHRCQARFSADGRSGGLHVQCSPVARRRSNPILDFARISGLRQIRRVGFVPVEALEQLLGGKIERDVALLLIGAGPILQQGAFDRRLRSSPPEIPAAPG